MPNYYSNPNHWRRAGASTGTAKIMQARYAGRCLDCGGAIAVGDTIRYASGQVRHASPDVCKASDAAKAAQVAAAPLAPTAGSTFRGVLAPPAPAALDLAPLAAFLTAAKARGLQRPKLRVLHMDGRREVTLGLTTTGRNPGSISVKIDGEYIGLITPAGQPTGMVAASANGDLRAHLVAVAAAPAAHAKAYAVLMCRCSFCGLALTDAGSVEVGYGPTCAKHWGLPHAAKGTPAPVAVAPTAAQIEADERAMQAMEAAGDREQTARETYHTMMEVA